MVDGISIIGPVDRLKERLQGKVDRFIQEDKDLLVNLQKGLTPFKDQDFVLVVTSDIPMINGQVVTDFCKDAMTSLLIFATYSDKRVNDKLFPGFTDLCKTEVM